MEIIQDFLTKHGFSDTQLETYTNIEIEQIVSVINGDFTFAEESGNVANYAGLCLRNKIYNEPSPNKNFVYYFQFACEKGNCNATYNLGFYHEENNDYTKAIKYYFDSYYKGNETAIEGITDILKRETPFTKEIQLNYTKIKLKNCDKTEIASLNKSCENLMNSGEYAIAEKYLLPASQIFPSNPEITLLLAKFYQKTDKPNDSVKQYVKAYELNPQQFILNEIKTIVSNPIQLHFIFSSLTPTNELNAEIHELLSQQSVSNFVNRKNILSKTDDCPICYEHKLLIPMECAHFYCESCYVKVNRCAFCRSKQ